MNCVRTRGWIAAGLLWACASAQALPLDPIDWVSRRNGAEVCCGFNSTQTFRYDSTSDLFTYSSVGTQTFRSGATEQLFSSAFTWSASINEFGAVTDGGSMQWLGDFGSGFETLASGSIKDIGFSAINPPDPSGDWTFLGLQVLLSNSLPGASFDIGREFILNLELVLLTSFDSPFKNDFACEPTCDNYFSDSHIAGLTVGEPRTGVLALFSLGLLAAFRRKSSTRPTTR
jgi:hypothetical protein